MAGRFHVWFHRVCQFGRLRSKGRIYRPCGWVHRSFKPPVGFCQIYWLAFWGDTFKDPRGSPSPILEVLHFLGSFSTPGLPTSFLDAAFDRLKAIWTSSPGSKERFFAPWQKGHWGMDLSGSTCIHPSENAKGHESKESMVSLCITCIQKSFLSHAWTKRTTFKENNNHCE